MSYTCALGEDVLARNKTITTQGNVCAFETETNKAISNSCHFLHLSMIHQCQHHLQPLLSLQNLEMKWLCPCRMDNPSLLCAYAHANGKGTSQLQAYKIIMTYST